MFSTLLQIVLRELDQVLANEEPSGRDISTRITTTTRRILPCLRHYSSWLVLNATDLVTNGDCDPLHNEFTYFWRVYADALKLLATTFQQPDFPDLEYLLEEDKDTIAFTPFTNSKTLSKGTRAAERLPKPRSDEEGGQRHPSSIEMLYRIRGLLEDGMALAAKGVGSPFFWYYPMTDPSKG